MLFFIANSSFSILGNIIIFLNAHIMFIQTYIFLHVYSNLYFFTFLSNANHNGLIWYFLNSYSSYSLPKFCLILFIFSVIFIFQPFYRIVFNILPNILIIFLITNHMVIIRPLPHRKTTFFIGKSFKS